LNNKGKKGENKYKEWLLKTTDVIEKENPCPHCFGTGKFAADSMGVSGFQLHNCPYCKGTGRKPS